jgi:uncharacterized protein YcfJ
MVSKLAAAVALSALVAAPAALAQVTFYSQEGFTGRSYSVGGADPNFSQSGFNDRASSAIVERGRWEVCEHAGFAGRCVVLRRGQYPSLAAMGLDDRISSVRRVGGGGRHVAEAPPPQHAPAYGYYPRHGERLYQADVVAVRAVVGPPEQRCWVDRERVGRDVNVPGAVLGGVIGGVLGHQIGGGSGRDVATALGAIGGAAIGANTHRGRTYEVQRCETVHAGQVSYWDVSYVFRGREYRAQLAFDPGRSITVNERGEPRA